MPGYTRHSTVEVTEVLPVILQAMVDKDIEDKPRARFNGELVNIGSVRLRTFAVKGVRCVCCRDIARFFALERTQEGPYHLNLYGIRNGKEVLFTHDHTLARSLNGADALENTQPMCSPCNTYKSTYERELYKLIREQQRVQAVAG